MKTSSTITFLLFHALFSFAQTNPYACMTDVDAAGWRPVLGDFNQTQNRSAKVLPVVVHVLYKYGFQDIPDNEVKAIIEAVNADFRRQNTDTTNTPDAFKPVAADTKIEFALASIDPNGNPTTGVTHTMSPNSPWEYDELGTHHMKFDSTGGKTAWDTKHYINIWLIDVLGVFVGGTSSLPSQHGTPIDGVVVGYHSGYISRGLTHQLGHYLGLLHPFGNGIACSTNTGGPDELEDTPNQFENSYFSNLFTCFDFPKMDTCSQGFPGIMFMNYMDYSHPDCMNIFTNQQAGVMHQVIDSIRFSLCEQVNEVKSPPAYTNDNGFKMFPNPAFDKITLEFSVPIKSDWHYSIIDNLGRLVSEKQFKDLGSKTYLIDISQLTAGVYWIRMKTRDQALVGSFIKR